MEILIFLVLVCVGTIPAFIAQSKGRNFYGWWVYGTLFLLIALVHALAIGKTQEAAEIDRLISGTARRCPFCAETIRAQAVVCRFCGRDLPQPERKKKEPEPVISNEELDQRMAKWKR